MKQIQAIGFDMDYTLVRYHSEAFEEMTYHAIIEKLITVKGYHEAVKELKFQFDLAIRGLVIDKPNGNILKLSTYSKVKHAYHGLKEMDYKQQQATYQGLTIDLNDSSRYAIVDTTFSVSYCVLYMQIVDLKDSRPELNLPDYKTLENDLLYALDISHRDGTLKNQVRFDLEKYILPDEETVIALERFKKHGKKLWVITNSDYAYTKLLLDFAINPFLKNHQHWSDLFDIVITLSAKPRFFTDNMPLLKVDPATGLMSNHHGPIENGIYQGGSAEQIQKCSGLTGEQILYLGDHIYGDVLTIKKTCNWRTALVIEELIHERKALAEVSTINEEIMELMDAKLIIERDIDVVFDQAVELDQKADKSKIQPLFEKMESIDKSVAKLIRTHTTHFNPYWGEVMRAGIEPSRLAGQIEKYACIYMAKISDFHQVSPRSYFRPKRRELAHE